MAALTQKMPKSSYEVPRSSVAPDTADAPIGAASAADASLPADPTVDAASPAASPPVDETAESRHEAIAQAAYFLAQARGFEPAHELDDWLAAERQIGGLTGRQR